MDIVQHGINGAEFKARSGLGETVYLGDGRPSARLLSVLHRDHPGYVSFAYKDPSAPKDENWREPISIKARGVAELLPGFAEHLLLDSYFTLNGQADAASWSNRWMLKDSRNRVIRGARRSNSNTKFLTSVWADIDVRDGNVFMAMSRAYALVGTGRMPMWSICLHSGRGVWLIWLLASAGTESERVVTSSGAVSCGKPILIYPEHVRYFKMLMQTIGERCKEADLPLDEGAHDLSRVARIPGSTNSTNNEEVWYSVMRQAHTDTPLAYTMAQMGAYLGIGNTPPAMRRKASSVKVSPELSEKRKQARLIGLQQRRQRLIGLATLRGGVQEGKRINFLLIFAILTRGIVDRVDNGWKRRPELLDELHKFNREHLVPPLKPNEVDRTHEQMLKSQRQFVVAKGYAWSIPDAEIASRLSITRQEAELLGGGRYVGQIDEPKPTTQRMRAAHRQEHLRQWIKANSGELVTAEQGVQILERVGIVVGLRTVQADLRRLVAERI